MSKGGRTCSPLQPLRVSVCRSLAPPPSLASLLPCISSATFTIFASCASLKDRIPRDVLCLLTLYRFWQRTSRGCRDQPESFSVFFKILKTTRLSPKLIHFNLLPQNEIKELNKQLQEYKSKNFADAKTFAGAKNTLFKPQRFSVVFETSHPNHKEPLEYE